MGHVAGVLRLPSSRLDACSSASGIGEINLESLDSFDREIEVARRLHASDLGTVRPLLGVEGCGDGLLSRLLRDRKLPACVAIPGFHRLGTLHQLSGDRSDRASRGLERRLGLVQLVGLRFRVPLEGLDLAAESRDLLGGLYLDLSDSDLRTSLAPAGLVAHRPPIDAPHLLQRRLQTVRQRELFQARRRLRLHVLANGPKLRLLLGNDTRDCRVVGRRGLETPFDRPYLEGLLHSGASQGALAPGFEEMLTTALMSDSVCTRAMSRTP